MTTLEAAGPLDPFEAHFHREPLQGAGVALILAVDQLLDMGRSASNVVGNSVASAVVAKWENQIEEPAAEPAARPA